VKVGDLVRPKGAMWQDVGLIIMGMSDCFIVVWSGGDGKQFFKGERLELVSESR